jgi:hypothetical protein
VLEDDPENVVNNGLVVPLNFKRDPGSLGLTKWVLGGWDPWDAIAYGAQSQYHREKDGLSRFMQYSSRCEAGYLLGVYAVRQRVIQDSVP